MASLPYNLTLKLESLVSASMIRLNSLLLVCAILVVVPTGMMIFSMAYISRAKLVILSLDSSGYFRYS